MTKHEKPPLTPYAAACPSSDEAGAAPQPGTEIATLPPAQRALVVLKSTTTEEALKALIVRTSAITAPPVDKAGREEVHRAAMDHKNARLAIEKAAKAATEDAKEFTKSVSAEQKRLIALNAEEEARLFKLRDEYDAAEAARKAEEERKERERVAAIKAKIEEIAALPMQSIADTAVQISETLDDLKAFEVTFEDFAEFQDDAQAAVATAITTLSQMHEATAAREAAEAAAREAAEKLAAQRAEIERQARELAEQRAELERQKAALAAQQRTEERAAPLEVPPAAMEQAVLTGTGTWKIDDEPGHAAKGVTFNGEFVDRAVLQQNHATFPSELRAIVIDEGLVETGIALANAQPGDIIPAPLDVGALFDAVADSTIAPVTADHGSEPATVLGMDLAAGPDVSVEVVMVTIRRSEYEDLLTRVRWLECLEEAGVDNWEGVEEALRILREGGA